MNRISTNSILKKNRHGKILYTYIYPRVWRDPMVSAPAWPGFDFRRHSTSRISRRKFVTQSGTSAKLRKTHCIRRHSPRSNILLSSIMKCPSSVNTYTNYDGDNVVCFLSSLQLLPQPPRQCLVQGFTKKCRLSWLSKRAVVYEPKFGRKPMSTAVHK